MICEDCGLPKGECECNVDEEKEHKRIEREANRMFHCSKCSFVGQGLSLREKQLDLLRHIKQAHPEMRKFEL